MLELRIINNRFLLILIIFIFASPIFGIYLSDMVGYHEPLNLAAKYIGLRDVSREINWTPFFRYSFPFMPPILGYIASGFLGVGIILITGYIMVHMSKRDRGDVVDEDPA